MNWLRSWLPLGVANQWVVGGLLAGLAILIFLALLHAVLYIRSYGFRNYLASTFRIENESWRLIGILLLVAMACAMVCSQWA